MEILFLTCTDRREAGRIAKALLSKKLIACAKQLSASSSYLWKGKIESSSEVLLIMDSVGVNFSKIEKEIKKLHSFDTFVLTSVPVEKVSEQAKKWLKKETKKDK